jgi:hypothetical protein
MTDDLANALARLRKAGLQVPPATEAALRRSLAQYAGQVSENTLKEILAKLLAGLQSISKPQQVLREGETQTVTEAATQASLRGELLKIINLAGNPEQLAQTLNLPFKIRTASEVMHGAGRFLLGQTDVDEYPAWELYRAYDRKEPRLWSGDEGTEDPAVTSGFASRWYQAAQMAGDADAARMLQDEGRMIALKSSGIWQQLGEFNDGLGNPYPPFAFNSGMDVDGVSRKECIELGLLEADEEPEGTPNFDFKNLISIPAAA